MQNLADKLKNELKQIEMKEAPGAKIPAKITWELEGESVLNIFSNSQKKERMQIRLYFLLKVGKTAKYLKLNRKY